MHKTLTYEDIEEPVYDSIIEEHWDFQMCIQTDNIIRLYYDANGVLRKLIKVHPDIGTFGPTEIPQEHCLLDVELFNDRGEQIRRCYYTNSRLTKPHFSGEWYLEIIRYAVQGGVIHWEAFHISKDNLFSQSAVSEIAKVDVKGRIPVNGIPYGYDAYETMDDYCDPERDDQDRDLWYRVIRCASPYGYKTWLPLNPVEHWMEYRRRGDTQYFKGGGTLDDKSFVGDTSIRKLVFGPNFVKIGTGAFAGCCNLETVEFMPGCLQSIEMGAFADCINLKEIILPDALVKIGEKAFSTCCCLTAVHLP